MQPGLDGAPGAGRLTLPEDRPAAVPGLALAVRRRLPFGWARVPQGRANRP